MQDGLWPDRLAFFVLLECDAVHLCRDALFTLFNLWGFILGRGGVVSKRPCYVTEDCDGRAQDALAIFDVEAVRPVSVVSDLEV